MHENKIADIILDEAFAVHRHYGPGLFERVYEASLEARLKARGLFVERQKTILINDEYVQNEPGFVADLFVEGLVIIELKAVDRITPKFKRQLFTYLKLTNRRLGLLLNFDEALLKNGITRIARGLTQDHYPPYHLP
ncbi:GxxExxY protein [Phaeodactylibacter luteus]|uniref:GxxExxY protein n=1 Tax=Phaeodactylibacter luteus TaxID=1564516 RepID=A0A5C6RN40_9BACT|nr:GxxExxY protein [Phaeodactylibacter luteus]TXB63828.1 GxxExxY protein [Phaeodactylibacter luteus]